MRKLSIKEVLELEAGEVVPSITGRITALYKRKTGEGEQGEWSVQSGTLSQNGQPPIRFTAWNFDDLKSLKGREVTIVANKGEKHGLTGVVAVDNDYKGKVTRELKITDSASIEETRGGDAECPEKEHSTTSTGRNAAPNVRSAGAAQNDPDRAFGGLAEARRHLMRSCNLYCLCIDAFEAV